MPAPRTAILVKGYPRLSETFIAQELLGLQQAGLDFTIVSLRHPTDDKVHEINRQITAPVLYLPEYAHDETWRVWKGLFAALKRPGGLVKALWRLARDYRRDPTRNRLRRFAQALVLARELPDGTGHIHSHYLHTPSSVALYTALLTGLPWSFSAHAKDIWTTPDWDLREKLAEARWGVTCTAANLAHLTKLSPRPDSVAKLYHGLDFTRFPGPPSRPDRNGHDPADPLRLITVGRAVEKKGLHVLLRALAKLPPDIHWRLVHIGEGEQLSNLKGLGKRLGLDDRIEWRGAQTQDAVIEALCAADLFVLAAVIAQSGDRDGLPNVLMEAQAVGLACLATRVSAIPELIEDGVTGRLVPPGDEAALAEAITQLGGHPAARRALGQAGAVRVTRDFSFRTGLDALLRQFGHEPAPRADGPAQTEPARHVAV